MSINGPEEWEGMRAAGAVVGLVLEAMKREVRPRITTAELDEVGAGVMKQHGAQSAPALVYKFPGANCISLNDEAVHGIPGNRALQQGDLVKLDVTIEKNGFMADAAVTVPVGDVTEERQRLVDCAERAFAKAMLVARAGFRILEIGRGIEREVRRSGFSVIRVSEGLRFDVAGRLTALLEILLVVVLRGIKRDGGNDLRHDRLRIAMRLLKSVLRCVGGGLLLRRMEING